jgi:CHASE2 domain-containing sensor protein/GGDEF domain-containing protein
MTTSDLRWILGAAALLAVTLLLGQSTGWLEAQERALFDALQARHRVHPDTPPHPEILVVEVTDACVEAYGPWPWPRSRLAELVEALARAQAKVVGIDILFLDQDDAEDPRLAQALREHGQVVLASEVVRRTAWDNQAGELATSLTLAPPTSRLAGAAAGLGFVNVDYHHDNQDGVVRSLPLVTLVDGQLVAVLGLEAAARFRGARPQFDKITGRLDLGGYDVPVAPRVPSPGRSDLVHKELLEIDFAASGMLEYIRDGDHGTIPTVRAKDVLAGNVPAARFQGRVVLVGLNVRGVDRKVTPVGHMAGVQILDQRLLRRTSRAQAAGLALLGVILGTYLGASLATVWGLVTAALLAVLLWTTGVLLFERTQVLLDLAAPLVGLGLGLLVSRIVVLTLGVRRHIARLTVLHESGRRFSRTLDLASLMEDVCERYRKITRGSSLAVVFKSGEGEEVETYFSEDVSEAVRALLSRRRLQAELLEILRVPDGPCRAARLGELADLPTDVQVPLDAVLLPLGRFDAARGFVYAEGLGRLPSSHGEEGRFWATHAATAATALENAGLYRLATVDALTRLYLRHYFDAALQREFDRAGRYRGHLALLVTDVDHFKRFNDTHGHQVGDRVLSHVAEIVKKAVRGVDIACRYGGEEFTVILPETDYEGALVIAERIRTAVEEGSP